MKVTKMKNYYLTNHARERIQQRGINLNVLETVIDQADKFHYTKKGGQSFFVSNKKIKKLLSKKFIEPDLAEKLRKVVIVENGGVILTAFYQTKKFYKN